MRILHICRKCRDTGALTPGISTSFSQRNAEPKINYHPDTIFKKKSIKLDLLRAYAHKVTGIKNYDKT